ncbi:MAG: hypothetical protein K2P88_13000 [Chitinophagaceae bacterium]|nr:hypothetical protein [Chitinophagaceae bacterium]
MKKGSPIYKVLSLLVVTLFVFSITPQWVWHDQFSRHIDSVHQHKDCSADDLVSYNKFCHVQDWVVGTPFLELDAIEATPTQQFLVHVESNEPSSFHLSFQEVFNRRGPPALTNSVS